MLVLSDILSAAELAAVRASIEAGAWVPGAETAGTQARRVKDNDQLDPGSEEAIAAGRAVMAALERSPRFMAAALPARILPPTFSRYGPGQGYGAHVDNALRFEGGAPVRADVSATLFLSDPDDYDGGALVVETGSAAQHVKLPAGALVVYPSTSVHRVEQVTRGTRLAAVIWAQSLVRDADARAMLFELDGAIQALGEHPSAVTLTGVYHNLLRRWAG